MLKKGTAQHNPNRIWYGKLLLYEITIIYKLVFVFDKMDLVFISNIIVKSTSPIITETIHPLNENKEHPTIIKATVIMV